MPPQASVNPTEQVLEVVQAIQAGNGDVAQLSELLNQRRREMNKNFANFLAAVEGQGEDFEHNLADEIGGVETHFLEYDEAIKKLATFETEKKAEILKEGAHDLQEAAGRLRLAMQRYEERYLSLGPSQFPMVNYLTNVAAQVVAEKINPALWENACNLYVDFYGKAVAEIDASSYKDKESVVARRAALAELEALLKVFRSEGAKGATPERLQDLSEILVDLEAAVEQFNTEEVGLSPSTSPRANIIIHATRGVLNGKLPSAVLKKLTASYLALVQSSISELQSASHTKTDSMLLSEEVANLLEASEAIEDALLLLRSYSEGQNVSAEEVELALEQLHVNADKVQASNVTLTSFNETAGKTICPGCSTPNDPDSKTCKKCSRALPQMAGSEVQGSSFQLVEGEEPSGETGEELILMSKVKALFDACQSFDAGTLPAAELAVYLEQAHADLAQARRVVGALQVPEIPDDIPEEHRAFIEEANDLGVMGLDTVLEGIALADEGIDKLTNCLEHHTRESLEDGMRTYFLGTQKMLKIAHYMAIFINSGIEKVRETAPEVIREHHEHSSALERLEGGPEE